MKLFDIIIEIPGQTTRQITALARTESDAIEAVEANIKEKDRGLEIQITAVYIGTPRLLGDPVLPS